MTKYVCSKGHIDFYYAVKLFKKRKGVILSCSKQRWKESAKECDFKFSKKKNIKLNSKLYIVIAKL